MAKTAYLPPEIIEVILLNSLVKPLLRFKSVSKSWNALISVSVFVRNHYQESISSHSQDLFICNQSFLRGLTLVKLEDQKLEIVQELENPYDNGYYVVSHCEGVLLLTNGSFRRQVLWNPSSRTQTKFWIPYTCGRASYGLCHDPNTDDFKVVIVDTHYYSVFSCKYKYLMTRKEKFTHPFTGFRHKCLDRGVCVDGASYWVWSRRNVEKIIYYDPRDDKFKILEKPKNVEESKMFSLVDLGGSLCLRCEGQDETMIQIWIKEKGIDNSSWKDLITIENIVKMDIYHFEPQCLIGNKIVIWSKYDHKLVVYSPLEKTFQQLGDTEFKCLYMGLVPYLDSSFFPVKTAPESKRKRL